VRLGAVRHRSDPFNPAGRSQSAPRSCSPCSHHRLASLPPCTCGYPNPDPRRPPTGSSRPRVADQLQGTAVAERFVGSIRSAPSARPLPHHHSPTATPSTHNDRDPRPTTTGPVGRLHLRISAGCTTCSESRARTIRGSRTHRQPCAPHHSDEQYFVRQEVG